MKHFKYIHAKLVFVLTLIIHYLGRLLTLFRTPSNLSKFENYYKEDFTTRTSLEERLVLLQLGGCIHCGICTPYCKKSFFPLEGRYLEIRELINGFARSTTTYHFLEKEIAHCLDCDSCTLICPTGVPIKEIVNMMKAKYEQNKSINQS